MPQVGACWGHPQAQPATASSTHIGLLSLPPSVLLQQARTDGGLSACPCPTVPHGTECVCSMVIPTVAFSVCPNLTTWTTVAAPIDTQDGQQRPVGAPKPLRPASAHITSLGLVPPTPHPAPFPRPFRCTTWRRAGPRARDCPRHRWARGRHTRAPHIMRSRRCACLLPVRDRWCDKRPPSGTQALTHRHGPLAPCSLQNLLAAPPARCTTQLCF